MEPTFQAFPKIARLTRQCVITEKLDGTNAVIHIDDTGTVLHVGSRTRWITPQNDNYGFAAWARSNERELLALGPGWHYGEWWGAGIQRRYGMSTKKLSLFNTARWSDPSVRPACCDVVPVLYDGVFTPTCVQDAVDGLVSAGSVAAPGFMDPEGIVVFHAASSTMFKKTCKNDQQHKG
jgi:hypothetical protein